MPLLSRMEERGLQKGLEQGTRQTLKSNIIRILQVRFEAVLPEVIATSNNLEDISELQRLLMVSVTINSVTEFGQLLQQDPNSDG